VLIFTNFRSLSEVLLTDMFIANGVALSESEDYVLVTESAFANIWKYHLKGERAGQKELLLKTPGFPDNVTPNGRGGFICGVLGVDQDEYNVFKDLVFKQPLLRKFLVRMFYMVTRDGICKKN
jgi:sugar lactone lactonase YvrE